MSASLIDFSQEREKRVHDLKEKRLLEVRDAFERAMPMPSSKPRAKKKKGKKR